MKNLSTISFIVLIGLVCLIQMTLSQCVEYVSPLDRIKTRRVDCPMVKLEKRQAQPTQDNMFKIDFECLVPDKTLCIKVNEVFIAAGKFITTSLNLKQPITVTAKFLDLCAQLGCSATSIILGAA